METTYRIVPSRGTYTLEAVTGSHRTTVATYRTEDAAVARLERLQAMTETDQQGQRIGSAGTQVREW